MWSASADLNNSWPPRGSRDGYKYSECRTGDIKPQSALWALGGDSKT